MTPDETANKIIEEITLLLKTNVTAWNPLNQHAGYAEPIFNGAVKKLAIMQVDAIIYSTFGKIKSWDRWKIIPADYCTTEYWHEVKESIIEHYKSNKNKP